jgi:hypothetical protein
MVWKTNEALESYAEPWVGALSSLVMKNYRIMKTTDSLPAQFGQQLSVVSRDKRNQIRGQLGFAYAG